MEILEISILIYLLFINLQSPIAPREVKESHYRQVVNNAGFDWLIPFVISTSGALGNRAKKILSDILIPKPNPLGEIGFARKLMKLIAFTLYNHVCTETISYNRRINSISLRNSVN